MPEWRSVKLFTIRSPLRQCLIHEAEKPLVFGTG